MLEVARRRPERWDKPLDPEMTDQVVERLLRVPPFSAMDHNAFPRATPLTGLLRNDTRVVEYQPGEIIVREGDYGSCAMLVLDGTVHATLDSLPSHTLGRPPRKRGAKLIRAVAKLLHRQGPPEVRRSEAALATESRPGAGVFVQDLPTVLDSTRTTVLGPGELFGEQAAITRSPHTTTILADTKCLLLQLRWQGLRDLMQYAPALRQSIDALYRRNHLEKHLRNTPLLSGLTEEALKRVAKSVQFASYGSFDWSESAKTDAVSDPIERLRREPIVVEEGKPVEGVLLVRGGLGRMTNSLGEGSRTIAYLAPGRSFGAEELFVSAEKNESPTWRRTLRAVGRLDVLTIPPAVFLEEVVPTVAKPTLQRWRERLARDDAEHHPSVGAASARTLDFLVDERLVNGTEAMVIDLDRCTRCDDCVRACAATHEGNPRFVREGVLHDQLQFAQACMHCLDPVCMIGCPTGAIHRDEETGLAQINDATCVGCSTCANSCPYSAIQMAEIRDPGGAIVIDEATGQPLLRATKCDLCIDQPTGPSCQDACPHDALIRLDLTTPQQLSAWSQH